MIHKSIDFSQLGGFPLTQDTFNYLQQAYTEVFYGFANVALANGLTGPVIISGIRAISSVYQTGWIFYNGDLLYFQGPVDMSAPVTPPSGLVYGMVITETDTSLIFNDGSTPAVMKLKQMSIGTAADSLTTSFIPLHIVDSTPSLQEGLNEKNFSSLSVGGFGISGTIYYKKNWLTNNVRLKGALTITNSSTTTPPIYCQLTPGLSTGYIPATTIPFAAFYRYHDSTLEDSTTIDFIRQLNCEIDSTGHINVGTLKSNTGDYSISFDIIYSLD